MAVDRGAAPGRNWPGLLTGQFLRFEDSCVAESHRTLVLSSGSLLHARPVVVR
jgi:hypothetical protein